MLALKNKILSYSKEVTKQEFDDFFQYYEQRRLKKGDLLNVEGEIVDTLYYMQKGCIIFYTEIDGEEKALEFSTEDEIFTDFNSYIREVPSRGQMRALENSIVIGIKKSDFEKMLKKSHALEHFGRKFLEEIYLNLMISFQSDAVLSNEERYLRLMRKRPTLFQRAPQYLIASYLGLTAVGLSKIRKRLSEK